MATERPPLELQVELVNPDLSTVRWDKDAPQAKDRPTGITIRTQRYTGFADAQLALNRRIDIDYPDLGLLDGINLIGHDGSVAYEGRIGTMPRSLQSGPQVGIQAQGWMSHAKDEPFTEVYVDRDLGKWGPVSRARRVIILGASSSITDPVQLADEVGEPVVELAFGETWVSPYEPISEALWAPQPGITIGAIYYKLIAATNLTLSEEATWAVRVRLAADDQLSSYSEARLTALTSGYLEGSGKAGSLQVRALTTPGGTAGKTSSAHFGPLAVYGNHGLTRQGTDPGGFFVSDIMKNIAARWAPKLDTSEVQATDFPVPHLSLTSETLPYDAWQTLNGYHRWEMGVYENRRLFYRPIDLGDWDWEVRLSDPGTKVSLQGDDASKLCNGVIVRYRDLSTGYDTRLTPESHAELQDPSPNNQATLNGLRLYTTLTLSEPTTEGAALQMGRAYLAEFNQAPAPGSITVTGHIRDRAGHWQQGWKVRASDRLIISDLPNDSVRVVGETEWNHDSKTLTIAVDSSFKRLDAVLARLGVAVEASNLSLP
jgi:hypothetical protein